MKNLIATILSALPLMVCAQQNVGFRQGEVVSPIVNPDNSVTFTLYAPKAKEVKVAGDWTGSYSENPMTPIDNGLWVFTTPILPSELYTYSFHIDGVNTVDPVNPFVKRDVGNLFSIFYVNGGPGDYYQVQEVPHGSLSQEWYRSDSLGTNRRLQIYTPPGYNSSSRSYPVLYLLHGSGGDENAWVELGCVPRIIDNLIANGQIEPMIVVIPNGNPSKQAAPGETPENLNYLPRMSNELGGYKAGAYEMAFPEIVNYVDSHYRTIADAPHRAVAGLSMGGFHSLFISANYPELFDYVGLFSPGIPPGMMDEKYEAYRNLDGKLNRLKESVKLYWIGIGEDDFLYNDVKGYCQRLDSLQFPYIYKESANGHVWSNWRQYLLEFAPQLFRK